MGKSLMFFIKFYCHSGRRAGIHVVLDSEASRRHCPRHVFRM